MTKQGGTTGDEGVGTAMMDAAALSANDKKVAAPKATAASYPELKPEKPIAKFCKCEKSCDCPVLNKEKVEKTLQLSRIEKSIKTMAAIEPLAKTSVVQIFKPLFAKSRATTDLDKAMGKLRKMLDDWKPSLKK